MITCTLEAIIRTISVFTKDHSGEVMGDLWKVYDSIHVSISVYFVV